MPVPVKLLRITTVPISLNILLKGQLRFIKESGFQVLTISADGKEVSEFTDRENVKHVIIPFTRKITPFQDLLCLFQLMILIKKEKPNIVHSHTPKAGLLSMIAAKLCGVQHRLHTVAGLPLMESTGLKRKILKITEIITYRCASKVYINSFNLMKFIKKEVYFSNEKLKVIARGSTNGVNTEYFKRTEELQAGGKRWLKKNVPVEDPFIFSFIGRIVRDKGIHELVRAFKALRNDKCFLILIGPYEDLDPIDTDVQTEINNNPAIITTGFQSDIRPFLAITDLFVFPSYREGFPNVLLQAAAMGVPSIASDINGCNEIIEQGKTGCLVKVKSKEELLATMEYLMGNDSMRKNLAEAALINVRKNYDQKYVWKKILEEYKKLTYV